jgi:hypothetical protein
MKTLATAVLALLAAIPAAADDTLGIRVREWLAAIDGHVQAEGGSVSSTDIDLDSELGIDDPDLTHEVQIYARIPVVGRLYLGAWWVRFEGDKTLDQSITYADQTFAAGTRIESELSLSVYYFTYEYVLPIPMSFGEAGWVEAGVLASVRGMVAEGRVEGGGQTGEDEAALAIPIVGVHGAAQVTRWLRGDVEVAGLPVRYGDNRAMYLEAYGEVVAQPFLGFFAGVGYKFVSLDLHVESGNELFDVDLTLDGFYLTAGWRF